MTLSDLAKVVGYSRNTVKKWGHGLRIPAESVPIVVRAFNGAISPHDLRPDIFENPNTDQATEGRRTAEAA